MVHCLFSVLVVLTQRPGQVEGHPQLGLPCGFPDSYLSSHMHHCVLWCPLYSWSWRRAPWRALWRTPHHLESLSVCCLRVLFLVLGQSLTGTPCPKTSSVAQTGLNIWQSSCFSLLCPGIIGMSCHTWLVARVSQAGLG